MRRLFTVVLLTIFIVTASTVQATTKLQQDLEETLQNAIDDAIENGLTGVSLAVYHPDHGLILLVGGFSDLGDETDLTVEDVSRIASCSKVFVGSLAMLLVEEGELSLNDPISDYLDSSHIDNIENADELTIQHLVTHTSGLYDYYGDDFGANDPDKMDYTIEEALQYAWGKPAEFGPGDGYGYSNTNTLILGAIIEEVTGQSLAEALRERIFAPLELENIYTEVFEPVPVKIVRGYVHYEDNEFVEVGDKYAGGGLPDGGIVSSTEEMVNFMRGLFVEGEILDDETLEQMVEPYETIDDGEWVGRHIFITETDDGLRYEHDGYIDGYMAAMMHYPDADLTIAAWTNSTGEPEEAWDAFLDQVLTLLFE